VYLCEHYGLRQAADYWKQVVEMNEHQQNRFVVKILERMFNTVAGKKIAVFGFAFKADTGDTRESPAIRICRMLAEEKASVCVTDPKALVHAREDLKDLDGIVFESDPYAAAAGADAVVVLTDWKQFKELDYRRVHSVMRRPAFLFDGRNCLDSLELRKIGFSVYGIGKGV